MRRPTVISGLKNSQRIRVIVDGVGIYTTVGETNDIFLYSKHRSATHHILHEIVEDGFCSGICERVKVYDGGMVGSEVHIQVDLL